MPHIIEKRIQLAAPVFRVWNAISDYRQFGEWFKVILDGPFVEGQSVGGQLTYPGYEHLRMEVVVQTVSPPSYFAYTWHPYAVDASVDYSQEPPTLVEFRLTENAKGTLLTVTESGFEKLSPERLASAIRMNTRGWEQQLQHIHAHLEQANVEQAHFEQNCVQPAP